MKKISSAIAGFCVLLIVVIFVATKERLKKRTEDYEKTVLSFEEEKLRLEK